MSDFFSSDAGQCAAIAKQYLEGALVLDRAQRERGRILLLPTLALAGHGLEMMLKAGAYLNGEQPPTGGPKGHDVNSLWNAETSASIRDHVYDNAIRATREARSSGAYPDVPSDEFVRPLIEEYIAALGDLHGRRDYPLRYPIGNNQEAPRTPFLVKSLHGTADDLVKRPGEFDLKNDSYHLWRKFVLLESS